MKRKLSLLLLLPLLFSCSNVTIEEKTHYSPYLIDMDSNAIAPLNTIVSMKSYVKYSQDKYNEVWNDFDQQVNLIHTLTDPYHNFDINGIKQINEHYGDGTKLSIDNHLFTLIKQSIEISELTKGEFNPTLGELIDAWKPYFDNDILYQSTPNDAIIKEAKEKYIPYNELKDYIILDENDSTIEFRKYNEIDEIKLNLGAIAKGYALDVAATNIEKDSFILSAGLSSVKTIGKNPSPSRDYYLFNLASPYLATSTNSKVPLLTFKVNADESVSTSGDYEKYFLDKSNGKLYYHILNPRTGYSSSYRSMVSLVSPLDASYLDGLSTSLMNIESIEDCKKIIEEAEKSFNQTIDYVFVQRNNDKFDITMSYGYKKRVSSKEDKIICSYEVI